jgi:hypothetical protein
MEISMKRLCLPLISAGLAILALGCGGEKEKGVNSNRDKPKAAELKRGYHRTLTAHLPLTPGSSPRW